jgi:hypothetical protein
MERIGVPRTFGVDGTFPRWLQRAPFLVQGAVLSATFLLIVGMVIVLGCLSGRHIELGDWPVAVLVLIPTGYLVAWVAFRKG